MQKEIDVACDWWANVIQEQATRNSQEKSFARSMPPNLCKVSPEQIEAFKGALAEMIGNWDYDQFGPQINFGCDWGPDYNFEQVLKSAGISSLLVPDKTYMALGEGYVRVGCGANWKEL